VSGRHHIEAGAVVVPLRWRAAFLVWCATGRRVEAMTPTRHDGSQRRGGAS
jgi:hypothetical protein